MTCAAGIHAYDNMCNEYTCTCKCIQDPISQSLFNTRTQQHMSLYYMYMSVLSRIFGLGGREAARYTSIEQSTCRGVRGHPPLGNFTLPEMQSSAIQW